MADTKAQSIIRAGDWEFARHLLAPRSYVFGRTPAHRVPLAIPPKRGPGMHRVVGGAAALGILMFVAFFLWPTRPCAAAQPSPAPDPALLPPEGQPSSQPGRKFSPPSSYVAVDAAGMPERKLEKPTPPPQNNNTESRPKPASPLANISWAWPVATSPIVARAGTKYDRANLSGKELEEELKKGRLWHVAGWAEYDFEVPKADWYELRRTGDMAERVHDIFLDGKPDLLLTCRQPEDIEPARRSWYKEANFYLAAGRHTLRFRSVVFPPSLPAQWELYAADNDPASCIRATVVGPQIVHSGETVKVLFRGGTSIPTAYELLLRNEADGAFAPAGKMEFPATAQPLEKMAAITLPAQGVYQLLASSGGRLLKPADLKVGTLVAVDVHAPSPAADLSTTTVLDIDCVAQTLNARPLAAGTFWEKDGPTEIVAAPFGKYRQSSGQGQNETWATDGFAYRFDLPDASHLYRLRVDYPDDDRRTMGFWINDATLVPRGAGEITTGGVETGDHYPLTGRLQTHEAFFYPRAKDGLVVAVLNLAPGFKAAAARVRIDRIDSALPAGPQGKPGGRVMGFYFEEGGRWLKHFGAAGLDCADHLQSLERWGQWNRFLGANLLAPTVAVYQTFHYPTHIADGYSAAPNDYARMGALVAEKYNCRYLPEICLGGQRWFDRNVMGVWRELDGQETDDEDKGVLHFAARQAEECVIRDRDGGGPLYYNALHPRVQAMYLSLCGELADHLGDCPAFDGISSRVMTDWQWQGWNALPGLEWGYDDWTVGQFEQETGQHVPGNPGDPQRFRQRYACLTGPLHDRWVQWRCDRLFDFHRRLRDRIRQAKPSASLVFNYFDRLDQRRGRFADLTLPACLRELGIDLPRYAHEPGIVFLPGSIYGRRYSTPIADAFYRGHFFEGEGQYTTALDCRACYIYTNYFEVNTNLDWTRLGGRPYSAFDACAPGGLHERELYALALAEGDVSWLSNGGNGWMFGTPALMQPWLREYRALPAEPFRRFEKARDPVAVWYRRIDPPAAGTGGPPPGFYFYAVNRLPCSVKVSLGLIGAARVQGAADDVPQALTADQQLQFALGPYMLRAFRTDAASAAIASCRVETPAEIAQGLRPLLDFARSLLPALKLRRAAPELTQGDAEQAAALLQHALTASDEGQFWTARTSLERVAMVRLYDILGSYPPGLFARRSQHGYSAAPQAPVVEAGSWSVLGDVRGRLASINALATDAEGNLWAASDDQVEVFNHQGRYVRSLRLLLPYQRDQGQPRYMQLETPHDLIPNSVGILDTERLVAGQDQGLPLLYEARTGRLVRTIDPFAATAKEMRGPIRVLGADLQDNFYVACTAAGTGCGVYKYGRDGRLSPGGAQALGLQLTALAAGGAAWDAKGRVYLALSDGLHVYLPTGKELFAVPQARTLGKLAVSATGENVFTLAADGRSLQSLRLSKTGNLLSQEEQPLPVPASALAMLTSGNLLVGFRQEIAGAVAREFTPGEKGLQPRRDAVRGLGEIRTQCLRGYTQFKVYSGKIYFLAHNKLLRLTPGTLDRAEVVYDPGPLGHDIEAFALAPDGDLYVASNWGLQKSSRGINVYVCRRSGTGWGNLEMLNDDQPLVADAGYDPSDLEVDGQGRLVVRLDDPQAKTPYDVVLFRYGRDGKRARLIDLGHYGTTTAYGLHQAADGKLYIASATTRAVCCLSPQGELLWKTAFEIHQGAASVPLRHPLGITTDNAGRVWITDAARHQVLCLDAQGRFLKCYGHFGTIDDRDGWSLCNPVGIAAVQDAHGGQWLYIADVGNQRIVKWKVAGAPLPPG